MGNKKIKYILIIILIIIIAGIIIWRQNKQREEFSAIPTSISTMTPTPIPSSTPDETADWILYQREDYGFEVKYPADFEKAVWENFKFSNISGDFEGFLLAQFKILLSLIGSKFYFPDIRIEVDNENVCDKLDQFPEVDANLTVKDPLMIDGVNFAKKEKKDTDQGFLYDKIIYYTKRENRCYSITLFNIISNSGIESLASQDEKNKEQDKIRNEEKNFILFLEQKMMPTFKFLE